MRIKSLKHSKVTTFTANQLLEYGGRKKTKTGGRRPATGAE
jgi:hypothetical protein